MQDEIRRTVTDYFKRHAILGSPTTTSTTSCPPIVQLKKEIKTHALAGNSSLGVDLFEFSAKYLSKYNFLLYQEPLEPALHHLLQPLGQLDL